ncbi:hypothetical protein [Chryseobacterium balustinum]|uniref:hypothetical protein n=1 Tax=Chryseobacterium balustinum TaxID=246 RepID=UPI003CEBFBF2
MKKLTFNLIVGAGLVLGTAALFGQKSIITITPISLTETNVGTGVEGTWKIYKIDGNVVDNDLTKTFAPGGVLISKQGRAMKKTKWKMESGKLCINEMGDDFHCCPYKVTKTTLTYTILGSEMSFIRKK